MQGDFIQVIRKSSLRASPTYSYEPLAECLCNGFGLCFSGQLRKCCGQLLGFFIANIQGRHFITCRYVTTQQYSAFRALLCKPLN